MKHVLDPLANVPGVRRALLISKDGVPITHIERASTTTKDESQKWSVSAEDLSAFAGMAIGLLTEVRRSTDPLSWDAPRRIVMHAARGTLILLETERATIAVELDRGMSAEELRLPMDSAAARLSRAVSRSPQPGSSPVSAQETEEPPGLFPGQAKESDASSGDSTSTGNEVPELTTES